MALSGNTVYECNASATANNVNGAGFNPSNANMLTDLTTDTNTANTASPVASSASYNFVAGDVNAWLYVKSGTNWTPGWYKIASVASNKATLSAAIGAAIQTNSAQGYPSPKFNTNTVVGCATVGTPTSGTFTVDYSQGTAAILTATDYGSIGSSTTLTSSITGGFTKVMVGNLFHQTTTGTGAFGVVGWYEVVSVTDANNLVLDRTPNSGTASVGCTGFIGGAASLNSTLDDDIFETAVAGARFFIKNGSFTLGESVVISAAGGAQVPNNIEGYNTLRGDLPIGSSRPTIACAANSFTLGSQWNIYNVIMTGTASIVLASTNCCWAFNCKNTNSSTTGSRFAFQFNGSDCGIFNCEGISYRGRGISALGFVYGNYVHNCDIGILLAGTSTVSSIIRNISESNVSSALTLGAATALTTVTSNTFYGSENTTGTGISISTGGTDIKLINNIIYGFVSGVAHADTTQTIGFDDFNDYFNNDTDVSGWQKGVNDIAVNPSFVSVTQITGTAGTFTAANDRLVDTSKDFSTLGVVGGRDAVYIISGTGVTAGIYGVASLATTTNPNDTLVLDLAPGTNTTTNKVYQLTVGHNFAVTGAV